jgi:hypothetical protein
MLVTDPPKGFWHEVRAHHRELYAKPLEGWNAGVVQSSHDAWAWANEKDIMVTEWQGIRYIGGVLLNLGKLTIHRESQGPVVASTTSSPRLFERVHYRYLIPNVIMPIGILSAHKGMTELAPDYSDVRMGSKTFMEAVAEARAGVLSPTPEDYEQIVATLRLGTQGGDEVVRLDKPPL